jgi:O-methyltransferase
MTAEDTGNHKISGRFTYVADGLATTHNCDFIAQERFASAYSVGIDSIRQSRPDLHVEWRVHTACWAASQALKIPGDFVECGVNTGILSRAIVEYVQFDKQADRKFWLLDTYEGIPVEQLTEREHQLERQRMNNKYLHGFEAVQKTFSAFKNVVLVKGKVPDTLPQVKSNKLAYLSIDMNAVVPEIAAAEYFWEKLSPGAFMLLDDYGFAAHIEQKLAFDEFARERGIEIFSIPTGQGLIMK